MMSKKIENIIKGIKPLDKKFFKETQKRLNNLTKPIGSLGELENIAKRIVAITGKKNPVIENKIIFTLAADHGVVEEGVSAYPKEVTAQMVYNFLRGGAGINVLARHIGAKVIVADIGVAEKLRVKSLEFRDKKINFGTKNFTKCPAMTKEEAAKSIEAGIELVEEFGNEIDVIGTGDMGIGNTTSSAAITSVICNVPVKKITGRGTGIDDKTLKNKISIIKNGIKKNKPNPKDGIDVLSKIGGYEIGGLAGIMLAGARYKIPVVIDGFISGAAALIADKISPLAKQYWLAGHCSCEPGHKIILDYLQLKPILNLDMRLGEGTGSALAMNIIEASVKILNEMATFDSAKVSKKLTQ